MKKIILYIIACIGIILAAAGILFKQKQSASIGIIGGADGPTSILVAGKLGGSIFDGLAAAGILLLLGIVIYIIKKKRNQ